MKSDIHYLNQMRKMLWENMKCDIHYMNQYIFDHPSITQYLFPIAQYLHLVAINTFIVFVKKR